MYVLIDFQVKEIGWYELHYFWTVSPTLSTANDWPVKQLIKALRLHTSTTEKVTFLNNNESANPRRRATQSCPTTWRLQRCARPLAIRMRYMCIYACAVLLIGGRAGRFTDS